MTIVKRPNEIRDDILRTMQAGLIDAGVDSPQISRGSDLYIESEALALEISIAANNVLTRSDQLLPDTATEEDLDRILNIFGLSRRGASTASGFVRLTTSINTFVATGAQLTGPNGLIYQVTVGGSYGNNEEIPVESVDTGDRTNLEVNSSMEWVDTPAFAQSTATVSQAITGGVDSENDATARERLLDTLRNTPGLGNWQQVAQLAESASTKVQKAFVYPVANGPGTVHVAVTGYPTATSKSREIPEVDLQQIRSFVQGNMPEYVETTVTTVNDLNSNVGLFLTIPYPEGAVNYGTGGGWLNYDPWPLAADAAGFRSAVVDSITSNVEFVIKTIGVNQSVGGITGYAPEPGLTQISWVDRTSYTVRTATITSLDSDGANGLFSVKIDQAFNGIEVDDRIFPACENAQVYLNAVLEYYAQMGPGEKINAAGLLPRGFRKPRAGLSWFNNFNSTLLRQVIESSDEVLNATFLTRERFRPLVGGGFTTEEIGSDSVQLPGLVTLPPNIYVPKWISFYPSSL